MKDYKDGICFVPNPKDDLKRAKRLQLRPCSQLLISSSAQLPNNSVKPLCPPVTHSHNPFLLLSWFEMPTSYLCYTQVPLPLFFLQGHTFLLFLIIYNRTLHISDQAQHLTQHGDTWLCREWPNEGNQFGTWTLSAASWTTLVLWHITEREVWL